jgi:hypothetical protein
MQSPPDEALREILRSGIAAPSAENRHWLRFEPAAGGVTLVATDVALWSAEPHREALARISHGAVVENMSLRAAALGYRQATQWGPQPGRADIVAECRMDGGRAVSDPLAGAIEQRRTNRRFYRRQPLAPAVLERIAASAGAVPPARIVWLDDAASRATALRAIRIAETERFRREGLHRELFGAIRFDIGWRRSVEEGLAPGSLEVEPPARPLFAALRRWPLMRACTRIGLHHMLGLRAGELPCRLAPHLGILLCDADTPQGGAITAGRALQRAWLAATVEGVAFQPMAAAVALQRQRPGGEWVSAEVHARLTELLRALAAGRAESAWMLFRVGNAAAPSVAAGRPPLERYFAA